MKEPPESLMLYCYVEVKYIVISVINCLKYILLNKIAIIEAFAD